jgi:hypothetical protein
METHPISQNREPEDRASPRERLLAAAAKLFYRHGIRAVGVEAIAEAAGTNKMTLYRHFPSAAEADQCWGAYERAHPGDPLGQVRAWLADMAGHLAKTDERGCQ